MAGTEVSAAAPVSAAPPVRRRSGRTRLQAFYPLLIGLPAIAIVLVAQGYPLVRQFVMSFQEFGLAQQFGQDAPWVWFDNYTRVLSDADFWAVFARSIVFCAVVAGLTMVIGVLTAWLLTGVRTWARVAVQSAMLLAWATPHLSSLTVWQWLFNPSSGVVNAVLVGLGLEGFDNHAWLLDPLSFFVIAGAVIAWGSVPLVLFLTYAAMTQVDTSLYEAAQLDGAGPLQRFRHITIPGIATVLMLVATLQIIWDLRVFTQISVLQTAGGISSETNVLGTYVYQIGLGQGEYGQGAAVATIMLLLTLLLTGLYVRQLVRQGDDA
ncbi:sugar ABC transporter permease [Ruania suaedae]|uniref:carbohydrate ABC transporter permease n=1 Tax=Ruania suaedae TaxID=2897774 RepID=UPI001E5F89DF|nr:sugar ABC transporter permease [Ruania suaedae]UFU03577.1 sugar ABC transporter permease [Ruania suaedae]